MFAGGVYLCGLISGLLLGVGIYDHSILGITLSCFMDVVVICAILGEYWGV